MPIHYTDIRNERQWKAATGFSQKEFEDLCVLFGQTYECFFEISLAQQLSERSDEVKFKSYEELLFFVLYSLKSGLTYDLLALSFDVSRSVAFEQQTSTMRLLQMTLQQNGHLPKRYFETVDELQQTLDQYDELIIDGSEQRIQRPGNQQDQKKDYSGKKKRTP